MSVDTSSSGSARVGGAASTREGRILASAERAAHRVWRLVTEVGIFLRILPFAAYLVAAILSFWLWVIWCAVGLVRFLARGLMAVLLWMAGGLAPHPGSLEKTVAAALRRDLRYLWFERMLALDAVVRSFRRHAANTRSGLRTFMWWSIPRKGFALVFFAAFVFVPALYVVPRPNLVQVIDNNAIQYTDNGRTVRYVINAVDLHNPAQIQEYLNERVWWLGKVDPQGLKSTLQPGRYYRLWVVGIRWYYLPTLFPNIIAAQEVDPQGHSIPEPLRANGS